VRCAVNSASSTLKPGARETLARISGILVSREGLRLVVEGHTDSVGTDTYNQQLSERRAESVRAYLVAQSVASSSGVDTLCAVVSIFHATGRTLLTA
jgi:outer membrane protein OmpA-like peptidoglycan-associated protein